MKKINCSCVDSAINSEGDKTIIMILFPSVYDNNHDEI